MTMSDETKMELIKAFAYGYSVESVAEIEEITLDEAVAFQKAHANEIQDKEADLKEAGWM